MTKCNQFIKYVRSPLSVSREMIKLREMMIVWVVLDFSWTPNPGWSLAWLIKVIHYNSSTDISPSFSFQPNFEENQTFNIAGDKKNYLQIQYRKEKNILYHYT